MQGVRHPPDSEKMRPLCAFVIFAALPAALAAGGNCKNECEGTPTTQFAKCVAQECTQNVTACSDNSTATSCVCPSECQACYADIYGSKCGGCSNKNGYDWDKDVGPTIKAQAEGMGCSGAAALAPGALVAVVAAIHASKAVFL